METAASFEVRNAPSSYPTEADDERTGEVGHRHSSCEAGEQSGAIRRGVGGAKGRDRGECGLAKHALDSAPGSRVTGAGTHTAICLPSRPEVGAVCGKAACTDLCGGREVTRVPTANLNFVHARCCTCSRPLLALCHE